MVWCCNFVGAGISYNGEGRVQNSGKEVWTQLAKKILNKSAFRAKQIFKNDKLRSSNSYAAKCCWTFTISLCCLKKVKHICKMNKIKFIRLSLTTVLMCLGVMATFTLNYLYLDPLLIPDPCLYHNADKRGVLIKIFYCFPGWEGYHPFPSNFNFILTAALGAYAGFKLAKYSLRKVRYRIKITD